MSTTEHTNQLIHETSPYLLQHAHNPVDWYPWNDDALRKAKEENKPILLSIGYSACHWCHVMEHESFENEQIARLMNDRFISIKVDREERPDLDQIYQSVCQMLGQHGGWPLTMFLTPDLQPFWGGTYFPPDDRYGRPGFPRVLMAISEHYHSEPDKVQDVVGEIGRALQAINGAEGSGKEPSVDLLAAATPQLRHAFDGRNGGFGSQPKFPNTMSLEIFLRHWKNTGDETCLKMVNLALRKMAEGGIYDQLGGGFHRYSTDATWLVPHFEKMLYDNALLVRLYTQANQATEDGFFERIADEVLQYVRREMTSPEGGFYSTQDADSEGEEGKFFVWTPAEIASILGERDGSLFCQYYDVTESGNFEHRTSILHVSGSIERLSKDYSLTAEEVEAILARGRERLFKDREGRIKPFRDEKILTGWNGLMISAFAEAGRVFGVKEHVQTAENAARFIKERLWDGSRLGRNFCQGQARGEGYLDDYAFLIAGLLDLYEASPALEWIEWSASLVDIMIQLFREEASGDFLFTPEGAQSLIVRPRQNHDQAIPSGVSVAAMDLLRLSGILDRPELREMALRIFKANAEEMEGNPHGTSNLLCAWDFYQHGPSEVVILADVQDESVQQSLRAFHRGYRPDKVVVVALPDADAPPIVRDKKSHGGPMTAYICRDFTCSAPVTSWEALQKSL